MRAFVSGAFVTMVLALSASALADGPVQVVETQKIALRPAHPSAAIEVERVRPQLSAEAVHPLALERIEQAVSRSPF